MMEQRNAKIWSVVSIPQQGNIALTLILGLAIDLFVLICCPLTLWFDFFLKNSSGNCQVILLVEQEEIQKKAQQQQKIKFIRNFGTFNFDNDKLSDVELKSDGDRW